MSDYIQRVKTERNELKERLSKLNEFIYSEKSKEIDFDDVALLIEQSVHMKNYLEVLDRRLWLAHN